MDLERIDAKARRVNPKLRQVARWAQRASTRQPERLPTLPEDPVARWGEVAVAFERFAVAASGLPGGADGLGLLRMLAGLESAQSATLRRLDRHVRLLKENPFRTGRTALQEAARVGPGDPQYERFLETAKARFYQARELASTAQEEAIAAYHIASANALEGRRGDAEYWLGQAYASAREIVDELASQAGNVKVLQTRTGTAAATWFYPVGVFVAGKKLQKVWNAERAAAELEEFLPFHDCVIRSLNSLSGLD